MLYALKDWHVWGHALVLLFLLFLVVWVGSKKINMNHSQNQLKCYELIIFIFFIFVV